MNKKGFQVTTSEGLIVIGGILLGYAVGNWGGALIGGFIGFIIAKGLE